MYKKAYCMVIKIGLRRVFIGNAGEIECVANERRFQTIVEGGVAKMQKYF